MIGLGTVINTAGVVGGGFVGLLLKKGLNEKIQQGLTMACGLGAMFIGISGTVAKMLTFENGKFNTQGSMLLVISLIIGSLTGELLKIEDLFDSLGERLKKAAKRESDNSFVETFVNVSLIICVGAMAIVGSIQDGVSGDWTMLATKGLLDAIIVMVFASTGGVGAIFSAIPVFVLQGSVTAIAAFAGSFLTQGMTDGIGFVGSALVFCVGINICFGKKFRVANMVPAIFVPVIYELMANFVK
ncbi:MAG: DUF554 domain-containing protein [Clostridia bacterium]|nr:DUF554 domain-containing protein [Clostridia bacterium]